MRSPRDQRLVVDDNNTLGSNTKRGRSGKGGSQIKNAAEKDTTKDTGIILSSERRKLLGLTATKAGLNYNEECINIKMDQKLQPNNPSLHEKESPDGHKTNRRKKGRTRKVLVSSIHAPACDQNGNGAKEKIVVEDSMMCEVESLFASDTKLVKGIEDNTLAKDSLSPDCKKLTDYLSTEKNVSADTFNMTSAKKTNRRKRGRPRKVLINSFSAAASGILYGAKEKIIVEDSRMCELDSRFASDTPAIYSLSPDCKKLTDYPDQRNVSIDTFHTTSAQISGSKGESSNSQHEKQILKKANRQASNAKDNYQTRDTSKVKMLESVCITKEAKTGFKRGSNMSDDQPLSKWFEEMQSAGSSAVAKLHTESMKVKKLINETPDSYNKEGEVFASDGVDAQTPAVGTERGSALRETELPFVKNTSLWAVVESMEVFLKMPQTPHFRPLLKLKESSREGFAIATMVNFCSAVESISRLQFDDPKEKIDDILDSLNDLETHGFSVRVLRDRIRKLLAIKENHEQLRAEVDDIKQRVALCELEKSEPDKEIKDITEQIKKLEERKAKAESIKEIKDGEIAALEARRQDVEVSIRRSRSCYEEVAAAL